MITTPRLGIFMEDLLGYLADSGLPRRPITGIIAHQQVRSVLFIGSVVQFQRVIYALDGRFVLLLRVHQGGQLIGDLGAELVGFFAGVNNPLRFTTLNVEKYPRQANSKGLRFGPVNGGEVLAFAVVVFQSQVPVFLQPAVQVHAVAEGVESMVGDHHQHAAVTIALFQCSGDQIIHPLIQVFDYMAVVESVIMGRMVGVNVTPEGMLQAVGAVEYTDTQPF